MGSVFGKINEETPKYNEVEKNDMFEIRQYGQVIVAETIFQGKRGDGKGSADGFWALAGYIGVLSKPKNIRPGSEGLEKGPEGEAIAMTAPVIMQDAGEKIAMTAPVIMQDAGEKIAMTAPVIMEEKGQGEEGKEKAMVMQFVLPSKFTMDKVPKPTDPRVTVKEIPGKKVGAMVFNGSWSDEQVKEKAEKLKGELEAAGHKIKGSYLTAFYNSPYTIPYFRRNEIWYELES